MLSPPFLLLLLLYEMSTTTWSVAFVVPQFSFLMPHTNLSRSVSDRLSPKLQCSASFWILAAQVLIAPPLSVSVYESGSALLLRGVMVPGVPLERLLAPCMFCHLVYLAPPTLAED